MLHNSLRWGHFQKSFDVIDAEIRRHQPDVVINFYEPIAGLYYARYRPTPPMVAIAHQYMFMHPRYAFPDGFAIQRQVTRLFTRLTASGASRRLALSLFEARSLPADRLCVMPPLLRDELFAQPLDALEPFFLINAGFESMAEAMYLGKPLLLVPTRRHFESKRQPGVRRTSSRCAKWA